MITVLYVDREPVSQARIVKGLNSRGFQVYAAASACEARRLTLGSAYDCALARVMHTEETNVAALCSDLRKSARVVLALMDTVDTLFEGDLFDCGVDDVIVGVQARPESIASRIKARLRATSRRQMQGMRLRLDDLVVDFTLRTVERNGETRQLCGLLGDLLLYLVRNADHIVSRQELYESSIWADSICTGPRDGGKTFDVHMGRLRKIVEKDPSRPALIQSVRGVGWKLMVKPVQLH